MVDQTNELANKLDILIRLQANWMTRSIEKKKDKIVFLADCGLSSADISAIVGSSPATVSQTLYMHRKREKDEKGD